MAPSLKTAWFKHESRWHATFWSAEKCAKMIQKWDTCDYQCVFARKLVHFSRSRGHKNRSKTRMVTFKTRFEVDPQKRTSFLGDVLQVVKPGRRPEVGGPPDKTFISQILLRVFFLWPDDFPDFHNRVKNRNYFPLPLKRLTKFPRFLSEFPCQIGWTQIWHVVFWMKIIHSRLEVQKCSPAVLSYKKYVRFL